MNETRRQAYLSAMGIDSYFPRQHLPGARPSAALDMQHCPGELSSAADSSAETSATIPNQTGSVPQLVAQALSEVRPVEMNSIDRSGQPEVGEIEDNIADLQSLESSANEPDSAEDEFRFSLQFYRVNDRLAVINEVPYLERGQGDERIQPLLLAILAALEVHLQPPVNPALFSWPLTADDDASVERKPEALLALEGFMRKRLESTNFDYLLIFAGKGKDILQAGIDASKKIPVANTKVLITRSLHAMLKVPVLKKVVWEDIRSLQGNLSP